MAFRSLTLFGVTGIMGTLFINRSVPQVEEDSNGNVRLYNRGFSNLEYKNLDGIYVELPPYHKYKHICLPASSELVKHDENSYEIKYKNIFRLPRTKILPIIQLSDN
jgi:hypothetical protein